MKQSAIWVVEVQTTAGIWEPSRCATTKTLAQAEKKRLAIKHSRVRKYIREEAPIGFNRNGVLK